MRFLSLGWGPIRKGRSEILYVSSTKSYINTVTAYIFVYNHHHLFTPTLSNDPPLGIKLISISSHCSIFSCPLFSARCCSQFFSLSPPLLFSLSFVFLFCFLSHFPSSSPSFQIARLLLLLFLPSPPKLNLHRDRILARKGTRIIHIIIFFSPSHILFPTKYFNSAISDHHDPRQTLLFNICKVPYPKPTH